MKVESQLAQPNDNKTKWFQQVLANIIANLTIYLLFLLVPGLTFLCWWARSLLFASLELKGWQIAVIFLACPLVFALWLFFESRQKFRFYKSSDVLWAYSDELQTNTDDSEELPEPYCPKWWCRYPLDFDDRSWTFYCDKCAFRKQLTYELESYVSNPYTFLQRFAAKDIAYQKALSQRPLNWLGSKLWPLYRHIRRHTRRLLRSTRRLLRSTLRKRQ